MAISEEETDAKSSMTTRASTPGGRVLLVSSSFILILDHTSSLVRAGEVRSTSM